MRRAPASAACERRVCGACRRSGVEVQGIDAAAAERLDECDAVVVFVIANQIEVGRDQRAQVLEERRRRPAADSRARGCTW